MGLKSKNRSGDSSILLVCSAPLDAVVGSTLQRIRTVFTATTLAAARAAIARGGLFDAWALADPLPDGTTFDLLAEFDSHPPTIMFFGRLDADAMNRAVALGAVPAAWPIGTSELGSFLKRADAAAANRLETHTARLKQSARLSAREAAVYAELVLGAGAKEIAKHHGVEECTVRTQFAQILRKLNEPSIDAVRAKTLRQILKAPRSSR